MTPDFEVWAVLRRKNAGYQTHRDKVAHMSLGSSYRMLDASVGQSSTWVVLQVEGIPTKFNSVNFDFFENGQELDIFQDPRWNGYLELWSYDDDEGELSEEEYRRVRKEVAAKRRLTTTD